MPPRSPLSRIRTALGAYVDGGDALARVDAARRIREAAEELEAAAIRAARDGGATWSALGGLYGLTKQGAQQRFRPVVESVAAEKPAEKTDRAAVKPADRAPKKRAR